MVTQQQILFRQECTKERPNRYSRVTVQLSQPAGPPTHTGCSAFSKALCLSFWGCFPWPGLFSPKKSSTGPILAWQLLQVSRISCPREVAVTLPARSDATPGLHVCTSPAGPLHSVLRPGAGANRLPPPWPQGCSASWSDGSMPRRPSTHRCRMDE